MYTRLIITVLALAALAFSACGGGSPTTEPVVPQELSQDESLAPGDEGMAMPDDTHLISIELTTTDIQMPASVPEGMVEFQVTNTNSVEQNLVIEGPGIMAELPGELGPGETNTLVLDLTPGVYTVYSSPVDQPEQITFTTFSVDG